MMTDVVFRAGKLQSANLRMKALRDWIRVAETVRPICLNVRKFDELIRHQRERLSRFMSEDLKSMIKLNITSLFDAAELLVSKDHFGPAIHLMMGAREECVKWILVHCWGHLDQSSRAKIFSHAFKHKTAGIYYFMSGQLQAIDFAVGGLELLKQKDPQISEACAALIELLPKALGGPESIAKTIMSSLHNAGPPGESKEMAEKRTAALAKKVDDAEKLRQNSIYVDFDQGLQVSGRPQDFKKDDYDRMKKDVILAKYHIDKLSGLEPSKEILHSTFPEWNDELEESLKELAESLAE